MHKSRQHKVNDRLYPSQPSWWVRLVLICGQFVVRRLFPCTVSGLAHYSGAPATLVVSNHRRDVDGPLLGAVLLRRHGLRLQQPLPQFVAREDLFERGFLAHYLPTWPRFLRPLLAQLDLRWFLRRCGAHPLQRTHEQSVAQVLHTLLDSAGDMPVAQALRPQRLQALARRVGSMADNARISALLRGHNTRLWRTRHGYRYLRLAMFRRIKPHLRANIEQQLDYFANLLDAGHMVILEPEGRLSRNGYLRRPQAAMHEFLMRSSQPVRVLPVAVTYDELTLGKAHVFVDIQPEMQALERLDRAALDQYVMDTIRAGCRVTGGQLAIGFLLSLPVIDAEWSEQALANATCNATRRCRDNQIPLDPCLLDERSRNRRIQAFIGWALAADFVVSTSRDAYRVNNAAMPPPWLPDGPVTLLAYLRAELQETVGAQRARELGLLP